MSRSLQRPAFLLSIGYGVLYLAAWTSVWRVHRTDPGDGLEYLYVIALTLPWALVPWGGYWVFHLAAALNGGILVAIVVLRSRSRRRREGIS